MKASDSAAAAGAGLDEPVPGLRLPRRSSRATPPPRVDDPNSPPTRAAPASDPREYPPGAGVLVDQRSTTERSITMQVTISRRAAALLVVAAALVLGATYAYASIPDTGGVIHGCFNNTN